MLTSTHSRRRAVLVSITALALVAAGPAAFARAKAKPRPQPKPKPVCNLVTDPTGNATFAGAAGTDDPALDITSADIATNAQYVTVAIRVAKLTIPDSLAPTGVYYSFSFVGGSSQTGKLIYAKIAPTTSGAWAPVWQDGSSAASGVVDAAHNQVRITLPLSFFGSGAAALVPGPAFHTFTVSSDWANPSPYQGATAPFFGQNVLNSTSTYVQGTPSCVPVGH